MDFDCFLSHNSKDKPAVRALAARLAAVGVRVWLDKKQLVPGRNWQPLLADGIARSATGAVLIGADGLGPWEDEEAQGLLSRAVRAGQPVIPVLLPGAPKQPELPLSLTNRTWVDLRDGLEGEEFKCLLWGIHGWRPADDGATAPADQPAARPAGPQPEVACLSVFLASSADAADERGQARDLIEQLPRLPGLPGRFGVEVSAWDQPGGAPMTPDEAGTAGLPSPRECRIAVFILGWTLGPPPGPAWPVSPAGPPWRCVID